MRAISAIAFACLSLAILAVLAAIPSAQPADPAERPSIFLTPEEELIFGPNGMVELESILRDNQGRIDLETLGRLAREGARDGFVTGQVYASRTMRPGSNLSTQGEEIGDIWALPQIQVTLAKGEDPNVVFGPYLTTHAGVFVSQPVPSGRYVLCMEGDGWSQACREIAVEPGRNHLGQLTIQPDERDGTGTIFGRVQLADGGFPQFDYPHANRLGAARVTAFAQNGDVLRDVRVNVLGDYVLPALPARSRARVVLTFEGADTAIPVAPLALAAGSWLRRNVVLPNSRPVVEELAARLGGLEVQSAPTGATIAVALAATDPDGDAVTVEWILEPDGGSLSTATGATTDWTVPTAPGLYTLRAVIDDGQGGIRTRAIRLAVSRDGFETFTGTVTATDVPAVANAEVTVNGEPTRTDTAGYFSVEVKPAERYVLNIRSPGHAFFSQIYGQPSRGGRYELVRATVQSFDPNLDIVLVDERRDVDCRGAPSANLDWESVDRQRLQPIRLEGLDRRGADLPGSLLPFQRQRHGCGPGAVVRIPAGALVDADGNPPRGRVEVAISTYDIEAEMEMPGDYTIADPGRTDPRGVMESYGAAFVEARDAGGELNLAPGATAEVIIPVAQAQLAAAAPLPPDIPIFHYDEELGVWNETGLAVFDGVAYRTEVAHFSAINADLEKVGPACIHLETQSDTGVMPNQFKIEYTVPGTSGAAARVLTGYIDASTSDDHVIYNLPVNTDVVIVPYDHAANPPIPFGTFVVNSGAAHGSTVNPPDHALCANTATLFIPDAPRVLPSGVEYLAGLYTFFAADLSNPGAYTTELRAASAAYYEQVDPLVGRRDTFGQFKALWGFDGTEINARYANVADLGFGRDMHCRTADIDGNGESEMACYVSNYGVRTDDDQDKANWASERFEPRYVATVAMEWAPIENGGTTTSPTFDGNLGNVVKFFVYGRDPDGSVDSDGDGLAADHDEGVLAGEADLDGYGPRPVPQLCMVCHGGKLPNQTSQGSDGSPLPNVLPVFASAADTDLDSRFLPFDLASYLFPNSGPVVGEQQAEFKALNTDFVAFQADTSLAIRELLEEYYGGPTFPDATQTEGFAIGGWTGTAADQDMYRHVIGPNCRTCHAAHDGIGRDFRTATSLPAAFAEYMVCDERSMPHSVRTYERFWTSLNPHQPGQFANWLASKGVGAGSCTFPPNNGQTFELP